MVKFFFIDKDYSRFDIIAIIAIAIYYWTHDSSWWEPLLWVLGAFVISSFIEAIYENKEAINENSSGA